MIEESLYQFMYEVVGNTKSDYHRYMFSRINWDARMIGLVGPRGVGKSTLLLQRVQQLSSAKVLYVTADHSYFTRYSLLDLTDDFVKDGGEYLFIDEVHKYHGWARELKQIYDCHAELHVVFTGSSVLDIAQGEADLSRRVVMYSMQGLSFREYLGIFHQIDLKPRSLDEMVNHPQPIDGLPHPLPYFREYLKKGYYPFCNEPEFEQRMQQIVSQTIEVDIPQYADMKVSTASKLKKMLSIVASLAPYKPNAQQLAQEIGVSKNNVQDYLYYLEKAGMIGQLRNDGGGLRLLGKVEKAYVDNPSLMTVLAGGKPNVGNLRETFFYNQMRMTGLLTSSKVSDFAIGERTFEVGGRGKGQNQIVNIPNAYVVKDDIEFGYLNVVPLWTFGLGY